MARPVVAQIVGVGAHGDDRVPFRLRYRAKVHKEAALAEVAPPGVIGDVARIIEFSCLDNPVPPSETSRQRHGPVQLLGPQARRRCGDREHRVAQYLGGNVGQESRVHAPGVRNDHRAVVAEDSAQRLELLLRGRRDRAAGRCHPRTDSSVSGAGQRPLPLSTPDDIKQGVRRGAANQTRAPGRRWLSRRPRSFATPGMAADIASSSVSTRRSASGGAPLEPP